MKTYTYNAEYASEVIDVIPVGYIDKTICGCGLTTVAIENEVPTIIAVPSVLLVENKVAQYPNDRCKKTILGVTSKVSIEDIAEYVKKTRIPKIMVTYDSLWKIESIMHNSYFQLIIDESDKLLSFSSLKVQDKEDSKDIDVLTNLFNITKEFKDRTSFISATPIPLEYMPDFISELPYIKMVWNCTTKSIPYVMERGFPFKSLREEILTPLRDKGKVLVGDLEFSKVIVFINSIENIIKVIKEVEIPSSEVCVIAGDSLRNDVKLNEFSKLENPSNLPRYTFITSSGFQGIDLYDIEAVSVVVSYTGKKYTMIDINTDLKQAISRQRTKNNKNYGKYIYIYNQSVFNKTEEELEQELNTLESNITEAIELYELAKSNEITNGFETLAKDSKDFKYYTTYNKEKDTYEHNQLIFKADRYFLLETKKQYTKGFDIKTSLDNCENVPPVKIKSKSSTTFADMIKYFNTEIKNVKINSNFHLEYSNKHLIDWGKDSGKTTWINAIETCYKLYGKVSGRLENIKQLIANHNSLQNSLYFEIVESFSIGNSYTRADVKSFLQAIYERNNIKRKAKHTDLQEIYETRDKTIQGTRYVEIKNFINKQ